MYAYSVAVTRFARVAGVHHQYLCLVTELSENNFKNKLADISLVFVGPLRYLFEEYLSWANKNPGDFVFHRVIILAGGLLAVAGSALAADVSYPMSAPYQTPAMYSQHPISAYVELRGGVDGRTFSSTGGPTFTDDLSGSVFGIAGRASIGLSPSFLAQGDVWTNSLNLTINGSGNFSGANSGIAGHLAWRTAGGHLLGVFASAGDATFADMYAIGASATIGVEAVHNRDNWRLYGQLGLTRGTGGSAAKYADTTWYVHGVATYYFTPNMALSGNLGYAATSENDGWNYTETRWGARLEYKHESMPVSGFLAYQGDSQAGDISFQSITSSHHAVVAGLRLLLDGSGNPTLRQIDTTVGLMDMNPSYGEVFVH